MRCQTHKSWELLHHGMGLFNLQMQLSAVIDGAGLSWIEPLSLDLLLWNFAAHLCCRLMDSVPLLAVLEDILV